MSDAVTNVEIEDVLSSISRLVSEDTRPSRDAQPNPMADRLVLTPAFRVPDAQEDAPEAAEDDDHGVLDDVAEAAIADVMESQATPDPETGNDDETSDADRADEAAFVAVEDSFDDADYGDSSYDDDSYEEENSWPVEPTQEASVPDMSGDAEPSSTTKADDVDDVASRVTLLQEAFSSVEEEWEPDAENESAAAPTPFEEMPELDAWEDVDDDIASENTVPFIARATASVDADKIQDHVHSDQMADAKALTDDDPEVFLSDEAVLDEEALRDLVSELVRDELQGALGERITRNVRKLVRREIHRALASMELE